MLKNAYLVGFAMLVLQALIKNFLPFSDWYGFIPGLLGGALYVALHKAPMARAEKLKALLVFVLIAGLAAFGVGAQRIGEFTAEFALSVSAVLTLVYAICGYLGLSIGSFFTARLLGYAPWGHATLPSMKNSYVLGVLMLVSEALINLAYKTLTGSAGGLSGMGVIMAMVAGQVYASWRKEKMPAKERFKALGVYLGLAAAIGLAALWSSFSANPGLAAGIGGVVFLVYGALMYFMMGWGSSIAMKALEKQAAKNAAAAPPQA